MSAGCHYKVGGSKKYVLLSSYRDIIPFSWDGSSIEAPYCSLHRNANGRSHITIGSDYEWDGPSGPTLDTADTLCGSLVHDVLYQLMREERLDRKWRKEADKCIRKMCIKDGMPAWRAWVWYYALRIGGGGAARAR